MSLLAPAQRGATISQESIVDQVAGSRLTRRSLIKAGAVVAGAAWVAPAIDSFATPAAATSPAGSSGLSFVTVLICTGSGTTQRCYRLKWDLSSTSSLQGHCAPVITTTSPLVQCGTSFVDGNCYKSKGSVDPTLSKVATTATVCPSEASGQPEIQGKYCVSASGHITFTVSVLDATAYTIEDWVMHHGQCCDDNVSGPKALLGPTKGSVAPWVFDQPGNTSTC